MKELLSGEDDKVHRSENVHIESSHKGEKGSHKNSESSRKEIHPPADDREMTER